MESLTIGRRWRNHEIEVTLDDSGVGVSMPVDVFRSAIEKELIQTLPSLSLTFTTSSINAKVSETFNKAFAAVVRSAKEEVLGVVK